MKNSLIYSILLLTFSLNSLAQILPSIAIGAGSLLIDKIQLNKFKNIKNATIIEEINKMQVSILRVPNDKIKSNAKSYIIKMQSELDEYNSLYKENKLINFPYYESSTQVIKIADPKWPVEYYDKELEAYKVYNNSLIQKLKTTRDSLENITQLKQKRFADSSRLAYIKQKAILDSVDIEKRKALYNKTQTTNTLVGSGKTSSKTSGSNTSRPKSTKSIKTSRPSSSPVYYSGPRGGCYYYNSNGNKQYVDRSLCN